MNRVVVGSRDPSEHYEAATVRASGLVSFLGTTELTHEQVAGGETRRERARVPYADGSLVIEERAEMVLQDASIAAQWSGDDDARIA